MSIQTRFQRRSHRSGAAFKFENDTTFYSDECKLKQLTSSKKSKNLMKKYENENTYGSSSGKYMTFQRNNNLCLHETNVSTDTTDISASVIRSNLFDKFQVARESEVIINGNYPSAAFQSGKPSANSSSYVNVFSVSQNEDKFMHPAMGVEENSTSKEDIDCLTNEVNTFVRQLLSNVKHRLLVPISKNSHKIENNYIKKEEKFNVQASDNIFESLPINGDKSLCDIKKLASDYLDTFLSVIDNCDDEIYGRKSYAPNLTKRCFLTSSSGSVQQNIQPCSFGDSLFDEGYISKRLDRHYVCPWPSTDRCLLSSEVENKNYGNIFVVRHQKRPRPEDCQKRRRSYMFSQPPKYITPMEYHNRTMEHIEHMERRRWQNIVKSHDHEGFYYGKSPSRIPDYILHNETKHALSTNSELLSYMGNRLIKFSDETWKRVESMAKSASSPLIELSPFHVDRFFCQFFFFSAGFSRQSKKRKRNYLLRYFQPELYIMPHHRYHPPPEDNSSLKAFPNILTPAPEKNTDVKQEAHSRNANSIVDNFAKEHIPTLPEIPSRACVLTSSSSPELRTVENVYSFKKRNLN